jgi:hypothetical protein
VLALLVGFGVMADARDSGIVTSAHVGAPQDWSSRAVVFAHAETPLEASRGNAVHASRVRRLANDPRYVMALARRFEREADLRTPATTTRGTYRPMFPRRGRPPHQFETGIHRDWSNVLGGGNGGLGGAGAAGVFPAKYNFDISAAPDCGNDFIVYPTNAASATAASGTNETYVSSFTGDPGQGPASTVTIGSAPPRQVVLTSSASSNSGSSFLTTGVGVDNVARAINLRDAVNRWTAQTGFSASVNGAQITISSATLGDISNAAVSENLNNNFDGGNNWPGVNGSGSAGQPTIVAFNQLYNGSCNAGRSNSNAPNTMWAYNTGSGYLAETSPVLSYYDNGRQVAFVQRNGNTLQLVLLKWQQGQGTAAAPATPTLSANAAAYRACASNCYYAITLAGTSNTAGTATYSSPFVDYFGDVLWLGDGNGRLHKFTGVFKGTPAEVVSGGFPATVAAGMKLSPPVYGFNGFVYVGSQSGGAGVGGMMHRVDASTGAVTSSAKMANDSSSGLRSSPILDVSTGSVFGFLFNDGSAGDGSTCQIVSGQDNACRVVARFALGFAAGTAPLQRAYVGRGNDIASALYAGAFDDAYYNSPNGTGAMYIVGGDPANTFQATLWKIPLANGAMQAPVKGATVGSYAVGSYNWSPVTLIRNTSSGSNEYLYFSMSATGAAAGCTGACLYMFNLNDLNGSASGTGAAWGTGNAASAGLTVYGGTGGIVVDNISATAGASQVYFSHAATTGNAVQASQNALN